MIDTDASIATFVTPIGYNNKEYGVWNRLLPVGITPYTRVPESRRSSNLKPTESPHNHRGQTMSVDKHQRHSIPSLRYEWSDDGIFEDHASVLAIHRNFARPEFSVNFNEGQP